MKLTKLQIHRMFFLIVTTFAISLCVVLAGGKIRESEISLDDNEDPADVPYTVTISGAIVKRDLNNLFETSQLVAVCEIVSEPDSFYIQNVSGGKEILSDVTIIATGRKGADWLDEMCRLHGVGREPGVVDIGVRVEMKDMIWREFSSRIY